MARHLAWVLTAALAYGAPASASTLCGHEAADLEQADTQGGARRTTATATIGRPAETSIARGSSGRATARRSWASRTSSPPKSSRFSRPTCRSSRPPRTRSTSSKRRCRRPSRTTRRTWPPSRSRSDRLEAARAELYKTRTLMLYRMRGVLSPEQRVKLQAAWEASRPKGNDPAASGVDVLLVSCISQSPGGFLE